MNLSDAVKLRISTVAVRELKIPGMSVEAVSRVRDMEEILSEQEQVPFVTHHLFHAGVYTRTIVIAAGVWLTAALIKRSTVFTVSGDATVATGEGSVRLTGYHVIPASAHRKQALFTHAETHISMSFATNAKTAEEAEAEFTDEADLLMSRRYENVVNITGE